MQKHILSFLEWFSSILHDAQALALGNPYGAFDMVMMDEGKG
jgi:hypothetical protein